MAENSNGQLRDGSNSAHLESPDSVPRPTLRPGNESITSYLVPVRWARTVEVFDGWVDLKRCKVLRVGRWWALYRTPLGGFLEYVYIPSIPEYAYFVGKARASRWFKFNPELAPAELWPYLGMVDLTEAPIDFIDAPADQPELVADAAPSGNGTAATNGRNPEALAAEPMVTLGEFGDESRVNGKNKPRLTLPRFHVIKALKEAGKNGLSKDELAEKSGHGDAHRILSALRGLTLTGNPSSSWPVNPGDATACFLGDLPTSPDISRGLATKRHTG